MASRQSASDSKFADLIAQLTEALALRDASAIEALLVANPIDAERLRRLLPTLQVLASLDSSGIASDKPAPASAGSPVLTLNLEP